MRINRLELCNFGSYEGANTFETKIDNKKNIIIIGGKNGAGKTTLFTAIRLCLYGFKSLGYKNMTANYHRLVKRLINNNAKLTKNCESYVKLDISITNGPHMNNYELKRSWTLNDEITERFEVFENGSKLSDEEIANFEKFLVSIIPPELFNMYFFDGEKIAEFFLSDGSNIRIKNAFSTLCGYDTFEIMSKNFKRICSKNKTGSASLTKYLETKEAFKASNEELKLLNLQIEAVEDNIANINSAIESLDKSYKEKGGTTEEEQSTIIFEIKQEEEKRESLNAWIKQSANDIIPFLLLKKEIIKLDEQLKVEDKNKKLKEFQLILSDNSIIENLTTTLSYNPADVLNALSYVVESQYGTGTESLLNLSYDQNIRVESTINKILEFDENSIFEAKSSIKESIKRSAELRESLEKGNLNSVKEYLNSKTALLEQSNNNKNTLLELYADKNVLEANLKDLQLKYVKAQKEVENQLKQESINDISAKAIMMLDKLQDDLYRTQIHKVEECLASKMCSMMRKESFIDSVKIDDDFNIHLYKNQDYSVDEILNLYSSYTIKSMRSVIGEKATSMLEKSFGDKAPDERSLKNTVKIVLPIEIDKNSLSAGEKQIFIMALYFSLVELSKYEVPFVIDTPFSRIDASHRMNISKEFFSKLRGQVFILSTDEEITSSHINIMKDKVGATFVLDNVDNKRTRIIADNYFEEA